MGSQDLRGGAGAIAEHAHNDVLGAEVALPQPVSLHASQVQDPAGLVEVLEALNVENARAKGWSWEAIATRLGVTKQAVHKKYAGRRFGRGRRLG